jgi:hypothetical protein
MPAIYIPFYRKKGTTLATVEEYAESSNVSYQQVVTNLAKVSLTV